MRIGPQNQSNGRSTKGTQCKGLPNNTWRRRNAQSMAKWTTKGRTHHRVKFKIYSTMFLYSKERRNTTIGTRLQIAKSIHNQGQNATTSDQQSNWET